MDNKLPKYDMTMYNCLSMIDFRLAGDIRAFITTLYQRMNTIPLTDKTQFYLVGVCTPYLNHQIRECFKTIAKDFSDFSFRLTTEQSLTACIKITVTRKPRKMVTRYFYDITPQRWDVGVYHAHN